MDEQSRFVQQIIQQIRKDKITFCAGNNKLERLLASIEYCKKSGVEGLYIEAGVAMGGSAMVMAAAKPKAAPLYLYDVYEMLPPPTEADGEKARLIYASFLEGQTEDPTAKNYIGASSDLLAFVKHNFSRIGIDPKEYGVEFVKGFFEDVLRVESPVAFCHVDCDWYQSVVFVLGQIADHIQPSGLVLFDDYNSFEGCKAAVDEWLESDHRFKIVDKAWSVLVQRVS